MLHRMIAFIGTVIVRQTVDGVQPMVGENKNDGCFKHGSHSHPTVYIYAIDDSRL